MLKEYLKNNVVENSNNFTALRYDSKLDLYSFNLVVFSRLVMYNKELFFLKKSKKILSRFPLFEISNLLNLKIDFLNEQALQFRNNSFKTSIKSM